MAGGASRHEKVVLVLQGGGALGAYQAGAYEALAAAGEMPDMVLLLQQQFYDCIIINIG